MNTAQHTIVPCPYCGQRLRIPTLQGKTICVTCPKCKMRFEHSSSPVARPKRANVLVASSALLLLVVIVIAPIVAVSMNAATDREYAARLQSLEVSGSRKLDALRDEHEHRLPLISPASLHQSARVHYESIRQARSDFSRRYAISDREKAMLRMRAISGRREIGSDQILEEIAREAAPRFSRIEIERTPAGRVLDIEFPMSSLAKGENGSSTKHLTVESLKKEVLVLIAKVTFDVFQFCRDLDLVSIRIGCRHIVKAQDEYGATRSEDTTLYKIRIDRDDLRTLRNDPFVSRYSTSDHFQIEVDEFPNLRIEEVERR